MALSGLDIYKLLPKTNCRDCGFATCLAFAMQLAKKAVSIEKCPHLTANAKAALEASSQPPIKLVTIGTGENKVEVGNETVLFRHEEKFHHPTAIGFIIEDSLSESEIRDKIDKINKLTFERVGQTLKVDLIAIRQNNDKEKFIKAVTLVSQNTTLGLVLISSCPESLKAALEILKDKKPLIYPAKESALNDISKLAAEYSCPIVAISGELDQLASLTGALNQQGISQIIMDTGKKTIYQKIWDLTQIRRQALKKSNRALGYPTIVVIENADPYEEALEAGTYISKYAGIVLMTCVESLHVLALLTLRQNIFTDPQKPLQIEPKVYVCGQVNNNSPLMVTTNFSLSYFTVLGEVEASKVPSYILCVDTEGMSVLTAWAAEKFNAEKINQAMNTFNVKDIVAHKKIIIPGYLAVMSGDLEEQSGWEIIVGPKEAAGLPSFLKNLA